MKPLTPTYVTCVVCSEPFPALNPSTAKYCGDACRNQAKRAVYRARRGPRLERRGYEPRTPGSQEKPGNKGPGVAAETTTCLACHSLGARSSACRRCGSWLA